MSTRKDEADKPQKVQHLNRWDACVGVAVAALKAGNGAWPTLCVCALLAYFAHTLGGDGLKQVLLAVLVTGPEAGLGWVLAIVLIGIILFQRRHYQGHIKELADARTKLEKQLNRAGVSSRQQQKLKIGVNNDPR